MKYLNDKEHIISLEGQLIALDNNLKLLSKQRTHFRGLLRLARQKFKKGEPVR